MIKFTINQSVVKPVIDKRNIKNKKELEQDLDHGLDHAIEEFEDYTEGKKHVNEMKVNFDLTNEFSRLQKVPRGDDNWYKHCGVVIKKMSKDYPDSQKYLLKFLVAHMLELLLYDDKLEVMNYLYSLDNIQNGAFEWFAKDYFVSHSITTKKFTVFIMYKLNKRMIMILNENNKWVSAEPEDQREIASSKEAKEYLAFNIEKYNRIVGFIGYEKSNRFLVFKTKDMTSKRDTGARCDESGKIKTLQRLNEIVGEEKFTKENTKAIKEKGQFISEAVGHVELCVLEEFILRYFNTIEKHDKKWFLSPEMAIWHKLYTIFT